MRRGTTPTVTLTVKGANGGICDLTDADIYVTFADRKKSNVVLTKSTNDNGVTVSLVDNYSVIRIVLTQADTLSFKVGSRVRVQLRAKKGDKAIASDIGEFTMEEILLDGEI